MFYLQDASIATYDQFGPIIYYNPLTLYKLGPQISQFVRAHEYAHHILNHITRGRESGQNIDIDVSEMRHSFELEADCHAAKKVTRKIAMAAADNFERTQGANRPDMYHPSGNERAGTIRRCAGISS